MRHLRRLFSPDGRLLLESLRLLVLIRGALLFCPMRTLRRLLTSGGPRSGTGVSVPDALKIGWAVSRAGRFVPGATCLCQALAVETLLWRRGAASNLHLGVARDDRGRFAAHAWLEMNNVLVIGGPQVGLYVPLATLEGEEQ